MSQQLRPAAILGEERLKRLVARCGPAVHLVTDTFAIAQKLTDHHPPAHQGFVVSTELARYVEWMPWEPLMTALQYGGAARTAPAIQCRHCQSSEILTVKHLNFSGSSIEHLDDIYWGQGGTSDHDVMLEFGGPIRWATAAEPGAEPGCISPESAPQLWAKPTDHPGFVTLYWARTSQCSHEAPLAALPADYVRRLNWYTCRAISPPDTVITCSGPAVNCLAAEDKTDGVDLVPCLRLPWWPDLEAFLCRHRETDFPPAAARRDICQFGVHLVPTGRPGSDTEQWEYRLSFSRAEVVAIRHLSPVQHATVTTVKRMKNILKASGTAPALKSYYIKTAVLWLVQDQPSDRWTSVTNAVNMVLDWLEIHLSAGEIPCFFWPAINLVGGRSPAELEDIITTVQLMKRQATILLMACCDKMGYYLDDMLLDGSDGSPLSEWQIRLRLARQLVKIAVIEGTLWRPTAPYWKNWFRYYIPTLTHLSEHRLLQCLYRRHSGTYRRQCALLQALVVAPTELVAGMRLTSVGGMFTWQAAPLMALLTEADMRFLLGNPAAVADWCHQQLCRPLAERPAGLTAELDTPQGRAELLLQPELLLWAFSKAVPVMRNVLWQREDQKRLEMWRANFVSHDTYQDLQEWLERKLSNDLKYCLRDKLPELDRSTVAATACFWRQRLEQTLSRLPEAYTAVTTRWADRWQLRQYMVTDTVTEGKTTSPLHPLTYLQAHDSQTLFAGQV